jgi:hypothetical protein
VVTRIDVLQVLQYGHGTRWLWVYIPSIIVQAVAGITMLCSVRYPLDVWNDMLGNKIWNFIMPLSNYVFALGPLPGLIKPEYLYLTPHRSPFWSVAFFYLDVRISRCLQGRSGASKHSDGIHQGLA